MTTLIIPKRNYGGRDDQKFHPLISPDDDKTGWAVRYLWIQHRHNNDTFYENYFDPEKKQTGMNVRKQTAELQKDWTAHNQIFHDSHKNGNLVWRLKVGNPISRSIDYIEIWRNADIITQYFSPKPITQISENISWPKEERLNFNKELYDAGFDIRSWVPYRNISKIHAMKTYKKFIDLYESGSGNIIFNSWWKRELNPCW
jgi:hypothetical protein